MKHLMVCLVMIFLLPTFPSWAEVRWGAVEWDRARVIPQGQSQFHIRYTTHQTQQIFGNNGDSENLGAGYQDVVRFSELGSHEDNSSSFLGVLRNEGVSPDAPAWTTEYALETQETTAELLWTKGVTSSWMIGVRVPFIESSTKISAKTTPSESYLKLQEKYQKSRGPKGSEVIETLQTSDEQKDQLFAQNDWNPVEETSVTRGLGDVELLSQFQMIQTTQYLASFRQRIVAPTGKSTTPYDYIQPSAVDGQTDIGADLLLDFRPTDVWTLTTSVGYTVQLADNQSLRIPVENQSRLVWQIDPDTERDLGDYWTARINSTWRLARRWWALAGIEHLNKQPDQYKGQVFSADQYEVLSEATAEERNLARVGVRVASPVWKHGLLDQSRWFAGVEYIKVVSGRNTPEIEATSIEWALTY